MAKVTLPPPPDGFEIAPETPAPPAGFVLEAADLPAPPDGFEIQAAAPPPANANIPQLRAPEPKPAWKRALTAVRESMTPLLGPTEAQILADGVTAEDGTIQYKPMGGRVDQEGFFPALSHPMIPLPRMQAPVRSPAEILQDPMWQMMSDVPMIPPETVAAAVNTGAGFMEFAESPLGAATGGIGALGKIVGSTATPRVIAGAYAADIASKTPEAARQAGELSVTGTPQEALESLLQLGVNIALPGVLAAHAVAPGKVQTGTPEGRNAPAQPEVFSEFGSEARAREEAAGPAEPSLNVTKTPIEGGAKPPARAVPAPPEGFVVEGQPQQTTVPELPATLHAQVVKMQEGRAPAVLFTPADTIPEWALKDQRFDVVETTEGRVMFDTAAWTKDEITRLVDNNQMGTVLGYGVPNRPAQATGAVVVRDKAGLELRAVGVNEATAPAVLEAAKRYAGEGDLVALEPLENVIAKRLDRSGTGAAVRTVDATAQAAQYAEGKRYREEQAKAATVPAEAAPRELPADVKVKVEGLDRKTGAPTETAARPAVEVAERHLKEAREAVAQLRGENVERPPDLIDELQNVTRGPVRVPAELQDVVNASRERIARELHNKPWQRLSSAQRKSIDRELKVSTSEGMPADQVLTGLGEKQRELTVDDFANALLDAAEGRLLERKKGDSAEVRAMAEEIARAESEAGRANETDRTERAPEDIDPWQETIDALDSLKLDTKGQLHAFGLLPEAWNTLIDIAKLAVKSGRALGEAIDYAIAEFKRRNPDAILTDEAAARRALMVATGVKEAVPSRFQLAKPISGPTGAKIIGYEWRSTMGEKYSAREGGMVEARISDWSNSDSSTGTGREIVHVYYVQHPDGSVKPEGIRSAQTVLGISETKLQSIAKKERAAQDWKESQERAEMTTYEKYAKPTLAEAARDYRVNNYSPMRSFEENNAIFNQSIPFEKDGKFVRRSANVAERMERYGWKVVSKDPAKPAATEPKTQPQPKLSQPQLEFALDSLKLDTKGQLHAFGLLPEAWNTLIDIAKLAVKSGRALGEAIDYAIEQIKQRYPGALTDEAGVRAQLMQEVPTRATGEKIASSGVISDEVKLAIQEYIYDPRSNLKDSEQATGIVMDHGVDAAIQLWRNPPDWMPGAVKSKLLGAITRHLANAERAATDAATKAALVEQQRALWDEALPRITNVAQELQAMNDLVLMSPDAHVARAKRDVAKAGEAEMERHKPETDAMRRALNEGRDAGLEAVKQDPATNAAAREAVNEAIKESAETKRAIVMELAQPWAQSEYILNTAREAVRAKANELLNTQPRPPQFTPAQHLRKILDDLAQRAADIFAGHIQGAEPSVALVDKLMSRLGIDRPQAVKLASSLSKEWDRQLEQARKNLDTRLANARARQERREREADSNAAVDRALRRQLREMNLKLGDAIRQAATTRSATGETIADRVVQASGLTGPKAEALRQRLQARWNELVAEAQRNALAAIENRSGVKVTRKMREAFERLVELDRLAPVEGEAFFKAVRSALKLPEMTEAQAAEIRRLAQRAMEQPEGWRQQQALAALNTYIDQAAGKYKWHDKAMSFYYSGLLASPSTWTANASGNLMMQFSQLATEIMLHPRQTSLILQGFADGMGKGYAAGWHTMRTGEVLGLRLDKIQGSRWLEATKLPGKLDWALTKFRIPGRVMGAQDLIAFSRLAELKWNLIAAEVASKQGLRGTQLAKEVQRLLHNTEADWQTARAQAAQEGLKGNDAYRRAHEIIEQRRDNTLPGSAQRARQYGLDNTFNGEYEGWLGNVGQWLEWGNRNLVVSKLFTPIIRFPIKATQIGLEYSPAGWLYAAKGAWTGKVRGREVNQERMSELMARATYGTLMTAGLVAYLGAYANDDDPPIWLYGAGPADRNQRDALHAETGWIPYSFKTPWGYFSWAESPAAPVFAVLANYFDALKFGKLDEQDAQSRAWFAFMSMPDVLLNKRTLQGLKEAGNFIAAERDPKFAAGTIGRKAAVFLGNDVKMIDQLFDPQVYSADDVQAALLNNFPIARSQGHPVINVFGTPLTRTPEERFFSPVKNDPLVNLLFQKRAWPSMPDRERAFVGNKALGEDYIRPMTNDEYYEWVVVSGNAIRQRLTSNIDRLYTATPNEAQAIVSKVVAEERAKAKPTR